MADLRLRIHRILSEGVKAASPGLEESTVPFSVGETLQRVLRRTATHNRGLRNALHGEDGWAVRGGIIVILNDRIINRTDYATVELQDGDEVTFLPMLDGG